MPLTAEDKMEIFELAARYALAMDSGQITEWLETWAEDGVWKSAFGQYRGKSELKNLLPDLGDRIKGKRHLITNCIAHGDKSSAKLTCYMTIVEAIKAPSIVATAVYNDLLKKDSGSWKFVQRHLQIDPSFHPPAA